MTQREFQMSTDLVEHKVAELPAVATPLATYHELVAGGADPEKLRALLELQRDWERGEAEKAFAHAMKACREEMPNVVRDAVNPETKKKYATLENVSSRINAVISKHGFSLSYGSEPSDKTNYIIITCTVRHDGGHSELHRLECPYDTTGPKGGATKTAIQGMGSAISYGRRYLKLMIFDVTVANQDNDGSDPAKLVSEQQQMNIQDALNGRIVNIDRFKAWLKVESVAEIPAARYDEVMDFIVRKPVRGQ